MIPRIRPRNPALGLTLIELLIVLGLILILTGLGLENYLGASVRAKVARAKAEFRTYATAIETYRVDQNAPPRMANYRFYDDPAFDFIHGTGVAGVMSRVLSTPIAYMTHAHILDPFMAGRRNAALDERLYTYHAIPVYIDRNPLSEFWPSAKEFYGDWRMASAGPDETFDHRFINSAQLPYDPTNGLVSLGNIWASQRNPTVMPPVPQLLGPH